MIKTPTEEELKGYIEQEFRKVGIPEHLYAPYTKVVIQMKNDAYELFATKWMMDSKKIEEDGHYWFLDEPYYNGGSEIELDGMAGESLTQSSGSKCRHSEVKEYFGLNERFNYCTSCNEKVE